MLLLRTHHLFFPSATNGLFHCHTHKNQCFITTTKTTRRLWRRIRRRIEDHPTMFSLKPNGRILPPEEFCIIEEPETVMDFAFLQLQDNTKSRRNAIFLLLEEVQRLRIQLRLKSIMEQSIKWRYAPPRWLFCPLSWKDHAWGSPPLDMLIHVGRRIVIYCMDSCSVWAPFH